MQYFQSALRCDRSVAGMSPLPLCSAADPAALDDAADGPSVAPPSDLTDSGAGRAAAGGGLSRQVEAARVAYDAVHSHDVRVAARRAHNLLVHLAARQAADDHRSVEVTRMTAELLARLQAERGSLPPGENPEAAATLAGADATQPQPQAASGSSRRDPSAGGGKPQRSDATSAASAACDAADAHGEWRVLHRDGAAPAATARELSALVRSVLAADGRDPGPIDLFARIRIEEGRVATSAHVAKRPGGIAAMYNEITLERDQHTQQQQQEEGAAAGNDRNTDASAPCGERSPPPALSPAVAHDLIPLDVATLVAQGRGKEALDAAAAQRRAAVSRFEAERAQIRQTEEDDTETRRRRAEKLRHERQTMLAALVAHDTQLQATRRLEQQALEALKRGRGTASSFVNVAGPLSADVLQSLMLAQKKPMHPVDMYQQTCGGRWATRKPSDTVF